MSISHLELLKVVLGLVAAAVGLWLRGVSGGFAVGRSPKKVDIQTLFHGNTKDDDQI
jgi:hypothetical protein